LKTTAFPNTVSGVTERMAAFMAHLRSNGIATGVAETEATLRVLKSIDINDHREVRLACKTVCTSHHDNFTRFDELFDSYWFNQGREKRGFSQDQKNTKQNNQSRFSPGVDSEAPSQGEGNADESDTSLNDDSASHGEKGKLIA